MTPPEPGIHEANEGTPPAPRQRYPSPPGPEQQRAYPSPPVTSPARPDDPAPAAPQPAPTPPAAPPPPPAPTAPTPAATAPQPAPIPPPPTPTAPPAASPPAATSPSAGPAIAEVARAATPPAAYRSPSGPATWVMAAAGAEIAWSVVTFVWTIVAILFITSLLPSGTALSDLGRALGQTWVLFQPVAALVILVGTPGLLAVWALRCTRNLPVLGVAGQTWSPGWAACGWFVPLANLAVPFAVVRELWTASGGRGRSLVTAWGVAWAARIVLLSAALF